MRWIVSTCLTALVLGMAIAPAAVRAADTLMAIKSTGIVSFGYRESSAPFSQLGSDGAPVGYSIDLCLRVFGALKAELGREDLSIRWVAVDPQSRLRMVADGTIHLECGSTTNTLSRQAEVDFSYTTYLTGARLLVRSGEGINRLKDLEGRALAVSAGTTTERAVLRAMELAGLNNVQLRYVRDHAEGFSAVEQREVDAYVTDDILLYGLIQEATEPRLYEVVGRFLSYEPYALPMPRNDSDFRLVVNRTLARLYRSAEIEHVHAKWFDPLLAPMPDLLRATFIVNGLPE